MKLPVRMLPAVGLLLLFGPLLQAQEKTDQEWAIAAIRELGGRIEFDEKDRKRPIVLVDLKFNYPADADLEYLKGLTRLRTLDLRGAGRLTDEGLRHLAALTDLRVVDLSLTEITGKGLTYLKGLTRLQTLRLVWDTGLRDEDLANLKGLTNLQVLNLALCHSLTDKGLKHLKGLTNLQELDLFSTTITDTGLAHLKGLTKLQSLDLHGTAISDVGLKHLKGLSSLRSLDLGRCSKVTTKGLAHLTGLTKLQTLRLGNGAGDEGLTILKRFPRLQNLDLMFTQVTNAGLRDLEGLTELQTLVLGDEITDGGLQHLKKLPKLRSLDLQRAGEITDKGLERLKGMTNLHTLKFGFHDQITNEGLANLKSLSGLRELDLGRFNVSDVGLKHLKGMINLQVLSLRGDFTDAGLAHLKGLTNLHTLDLSSKHITDAGLKHLKGLTRLRSLDLRRARLVGNGFEQLRGLAHLRVLRLADTQVSDASLVHLGGLTNLDTLEINSVRLPDRGLEALCSLKKLKEMNLDESPVSDAVIRVFKNTLPTVKIIRWELKQTGGPAGVGKEDKPTERPDNPEKEDASSVLVSLVRVLTTSTDVALQRDVLRGMLDALQGRRHVAAPRGWAVVYKKLAISKDAEVREKALVLSVLFGNSQALLALRKTAADPRADQAARRRALETLVEKRVDNLLPLLKNLLAERTMRGPALRGLAAFNDPSTPALILRHYASFSDAEKADAVNTLASRPQYALALLDAMEKGRVPRRDLAPFTARQLLGFNDRHLTARLNKVWGAIRKTAQDKVALLARYKALATPAAFKKANRSHGRLVFARTCANCHLLFDAGGKIGPELTGSQRTNPEYILSKVLDPNAVVAKDYQVTRITTANGRVISGIVKQETDRTITLQTPTEVVRLSRADIEDRKQLKESMMPEGQLGELTDAEVRDLLAYLAGPGQVPLPRQAKAPQNK